MTDARLEALEAEVERTREAVTDPASVAYAEALANRNRHLVRRLGRRTEGLLAGLVLVLVLLGVAGLVLTGRQATLGREGRHLAFNAKRATGRNCLNIATLAQIERAYIDRQETQSRRLLESGVTFGIPREQLPALIDASRKSQALFLGDLDKLKAKSCEAKPLAVTTVTRKGRVQTRGGHAPSASLRRPAKGVRGRVSPTPAERRSGVGVIQAGKRGGAAKGVQGGTTTTTPSTLPHEPPPATTGPSAPPSLPPPTTSTTPPNTTTILPPVPPLPLPCEVGPLHRC